MFIKISRIILRNRILIIVLISVITAYMAFEAQSVKLSYDNSSLLSEKDSVMIEYRSFKQQYGEDGNVLMVGKDPMVVIKAEYNKSGRNAAVVKMKMKNLLNGSGTETVFRADDKFDVPRLSPPLRNIRHNTAAQGGGISAQLFPMMEPLGVHGFPQPKPERPFDLGSLLINQMIRYLATHGEQLDFDPCQLDWTCSWLPPLR